MVSFGSVAISSSSRFHIARCAAWSLGESWVGSRVSRVVLPVSACIAWFHAWCVMNHRMDRSARMWGGWMG